MWCMIGCAMLRMVAVGVAYGAFHPGVQVWQYMGCLFSGALFWQAAEIITTRVYAPLQPSIDNFQK